MASTPRFPGKEHKLAHAALRLGPPPELSRHDRALIWACLTAIAALAWTYLFYLDSQMPPAMAPATPMSGMSMARAWSAADIAFTFAMWVVMMLGMMAGSAAPVLLLFGKAHAGRSGSRVPLAVLFFGLGYLVIWVGFSACATLVQWVLHDAALLSPAMALSSAYVSGAVLFAAGVYQMTPMKRTCLRHCQSPLGFLLSRWRDGLPGALGMGMRHGAYCLGCCWALMGVLFAVGVMNLVWVMALALLVLLEKTVPAGMAVSRIAGAAMMAVAVRIFIGAI